MINLLCKCKQLMSRHVLLRSLLCVAYISVFCSPLPQVCRAFFMGAYGTFTALYADAPRMAPYLMDALAARVRGGGLRALVKSCDSVPLDFLMVQLGLETEDDARQLIGRACAVISNGALDGKASRAAMART